MSKLHTEAVMDNSKSFADVRIRVEGDFAGTLSMTRGWAFDFINIITYGAEAMELCREVSGADCNYDGSVSIDQMAAIRKCDRLIARIDEQK